MNIKMARYSTKSVALITIISQEHYGATFFNAALAQFVVQYSHPNLTAREIEQYAARVYIPSTNIPVWHRIKFWNETVYGNVTLDSIHIQPPQHDEDGNVIVPARFDNCLGQS